MRRSSNHLNTYANDLLPLNHRRPQQKWGAGVAVRAIDGLSVGGKHLVVADESGVGKAITAPNGNGF